MEKTNTWLPNQKQQLFLHTLNKADGALTLAEVSAIANIKFATGTINPLVTKGLVVCNKNAKEIVCECCGHKRKVSTYEISSDIKKG